MTSAGPIALTLGDPAGIGGEVTAKWLAHSSQETVPAADLLLIGSAQALQQGADCAGVALSPMPHLSDPSQYSGGLALLDLGPLPADFQFGRVRAECGALAAEAVTRAAGLCLTHRAVAMVTCPINKEAIQAAGLVDDIGHQEILGRLAGATDTATLLMTPGLRVAHLSTHKSLQQAVAYVTTETVLARLRLCQRTLVQWGLAAPRIAVAGLNPHNGEGGLLGREELEAIAPGVALAVAEGIDATGPIPADSVFNRAIAGEFDLVLAMYHDQGHIAIKVHDFHHSTTATLGLPFVRTSVDHGTAFDIAGRGIADATGLGAALSMAATLVAGELG